MRQVGTSVAQVWRHHLAYGSHQGKGCGHHSVGLNAGASNHSHQHIFNATELPGSTPHKLTILLLSVPESITAHAILSPV